MIEIRHTTFEELFHAEGFRELVDEYSSETANKAIGDPQVQFDRYRKLEYTGSLYCIAAFDEKKVVGAVGLLVAESQHYPFPIVAVESFYLRKAWRKGRTGLRLLKEIKQTAWTLGAPGCSFMAPPETPLDKLCQCLDMTHTHNAYWCKCDECN
jgi:hypothetical protein